VSLACEVAAPFIANSAVDGSTVVRPLRSHTTTCLKCQARHAAMSKTARALQSMADERTPAPPELEWRIMSSLEGELAIERSLKKPAALVAALASMAAAVLIWRLRPDAS
jgi:anti-sigma factor RsiW